MSAYDLPPHNVGVTKDELNGDAQTSSQMDVKPKLEVHESELTRPQLTVLESNESASTSLASVYHNDPNQSQCRVLRHRDINCTESLLYRDDGHVWHSTDRKCTHCGEIFTDVFMLKKHKRQCCPPMKTNMVHKRIKFFNDKEMQTELDRKNDDLEKSENRPQNGPRFYCRRSNCINDNLRRDAQGGRALGFLCEERLLEHKRVHHALSKTLKCKLCPDDQEPLPSRRHLDEHMNSSHPNRRLRAINCTVCGLKMMITSMMPKLMKRKGVKKSSGRTIFARHGTLHVWQANGEFMCEMGCKQMYFSSSKAQIAHHDEVHGEGSTAEWDRKIKPMEKTLTSEEKKVAYDEFVKTMYCAVCEHSFTNAAFYQAHMTHHDPTTGGGHWQCRICKMYYSEFSALHGHHLTHHDEEEFIRPFIEENVEEYDEMDDGIPVKEEVVEEVEEVVELTEYEFHLREVERMEIWNLKKEKPIRVVIPPPPTYKFPNHEEAQWIQNLLNGRVRTARLNTMNKRAKIDAENVARGLPPTQWPPYVEQTPQTVDSLTWHEVENIRDRRVRIREFHKRKYAERSEEKTKMLNERHRDYHREKKRRQLEKEKEEWEALPVEKRLELEENKRVAAVAAERRRLQKYLVHSAQQRAYFTPITRLRSITRRRRRGEVVDDSQVSTSTEEIPTDIDSLNVEQIEKLKLGLARQQARRKQLKLTMSAEEKRARLDYKNEFRRWERLIARRRKFGEDVSGDPAAPPPLVLSAEILEKTRQVRRQALVEKQREQTRLRRKKRTADQIRRIYDRKNEGRRKKTAERKVKRAAQKAIGYTVVGVEPVRGTGNEEEVGDDEEEKEVGGGETIIEEIRNTVEYIHT